MKKIFKNENDTFHKFNKIILMIGYILSITIAIIVFYTGGTTNVYANLMYLSIALVSASNTIRSALVHSIFSALLIGPFMPLDTNTMVMQSTISWSLRMSVYVFSSLLISYYVNKINCEEELLKSKNDELLLAQQSTLNSLVRITEARDKFTGEHIDRIVDLTHLLLMKVSNVRALKNVIKDINLNCISKASALHDIGKVAINDSILNKPGKLTKEEFNQMKKHTIIGAEALLSSKNEYPNNDYINAAYNITLFHHEWYNGTGYPKGLKGGEIPFSARVVAIVDCYDALRSRRPYKEGYSHQDTLNIMKQESGTHFDPILLEVLFKYEKEFEQLYNKK